jgi:hypothetical protein
MSEKPKSPLKEAAERIEARLKAAGYNVKPLEHSPTNMLQATFVPPRRAKSPEESEQ